MIEHERRSRFPSAGELEERLWRALWMLYELDESLVRVDASERSITHRLAMYLQLFLPGWDVDCEYNRKGAIPKRLRGIKKSDQEQGEDMDEGSLVYPDIAIHKRERSNANLAVIEVKKKEGDVTNDRRKLECYCDELKYRLGFLLVLGDSYAQCSLELTSGRS